MVWSGLFADYLEHPGGGPWNTLVAALKREGFDDHSEEELEHILRQCLVDSR